MWATLNGIWKKNKGHYAVNERLLALLERENLLLQGVLRHKTIHEDRAPLSDAMARETGNAGIVGDWFHQGSRMKT